MRAVKSVSIDSERRVIITYLDGSTETLYPNCIWCDSEALRQLIKDLLEEKADAITQTIENVTVATFADGADEGLIKKLLVSIEPIQEGEGDPAPENVRPIIGRSGLSVYKRGTNLIDDSIKNINSPGTTLYVGGAVNEYVHYLKADTYTLSCVFAYGVHYGAIIKEINSDQTSIWASSGNSSQATFTLQKDGFYRLGFYQAASAGGVSVDGVSNIMLNYGETALPYSQFKDGENVHVNWETEAGAVYGGTLDVVSGKLIVDRANIANYNGEVLPSTWISDRDVYVEGTTPTTGAQVVYKLAEPVEYQLTPQEINTLLGDNNIWADSGNILELEYTADTKLYIGEQQSGASGALGSGRQSIAIPDLQPVSEKTWEDVAEAYKEEATDERGE